MEETLEQRNKRLIGKTMEEIFMGKPIKNGNCGKCKLCTGKVRSFGCPICGSNKAKEVYSFKWECENGHLYIPKIDPYDTQLHQKTLKNNKQIKKEKKSEI